MGEQEKKENHIAAVIFVIVITLAGLILNHWTNYYPIMQGNGLIRTAEELEMMRTEISLVLTVSLLASGVELGRNLEKGKSAG